MSINHLNEIAEAAFNDELEKLGYAQTYSAERKGGGGGGMVLAGGAGVGGYLYGKHKMGGIAKKMAGKAYTKGLVQGGVGGALGTGAANILRKTKIGQGISGRVSNLVDTARHAIGSVATNPQARGAMTGIRKAVGRQGRTLLQRLGGLASVALKAAK